MKERAVLFDLDGTLTDPKPGITRCIQHALAKLKRPVPSEDELLWCIGPPLQVSFPRLLGTADKGCVEQAITYYRERFSTVGLFENALYPGIPEALHELRGRGFRTFVATSKPRVFAERIVDHFHLMPLFDGVYGSELDGTRVDKGDLIAYLLTTESLDPDLAVMVGDREHDMLGGVRCGLRCVGVTYGYGSEKELTEHGALRLACAPGELVPVVEDLFRDVPGTSEATGTRFQEQFAIPGAGGIIRRFQEGEEWILLQERDKAGAPGETGLIEIPAGKIRALENIYDCLRREIQEETGLTVQWIQGESESRRVVINGYDVLSYAPYASSQNLLGAYPIMVQTFICEVEGEAATGSDESREIRWLRLSELARMLNAEPGRFYPMHLSALQRYAAERKASAI